MEETTEYEFECDGRNKLIVNLCCMSHKQQTRFLQMIHTATKNGIEALRFINVWNDYAQDITEHVFWQIEEKQEKFIKRKE